MPRLTPSQRSYWPPPVYVARFTDSTECRMSIWSREGEPLDFERGRKVCCSAIGAERAFKVQAANQPRWGGRWHPDDLRRICQPAAGLISGHFEHDGKIIPDPFFTGEAEPVRKRTTPLGRILASLGKLSPDDLSALSVEIDARLDNHRLRAA